MTESSIVPNVVVWRNIQVVALNNLRNRVNKLLPDMMAMAVRMQLADIQTRVGYVRTEVDLRKRKSYAAAVKEDISAWQHEVEILEIRMGKPTA